ncbi:MAG: transporter substrate-binding domain-containing protein, partial [Clostridia bacterium]|nr:transporter substrate-binding domain-containing protein [Clostridia bacterium]
MKRTLAIILAIVIAAATLFAFSSCGETTKVDISNAKSLADLKGAKIAAQSGTFHADALEQIEGATTSTYPEFADLLIALKSGAIDGYIAEEPTALAITLEDDTLGYVHLQNNTTGFTATDADVAIAVGVAKNSALAAKINTALATIPAATRAALMENMVAFSAGDYSSALALTIPASDEPVGTLKVAMECAYEPFNWTDLNTPSL